VDVYAGCAGDACGILSVSRPRAPRQIVAGGAETAPESHTDGAPMAFMIVPDELEVYLARRSATRPSRAAHRPPPTDAPATWSPDGHSLLCL